VSLPDNDRIADPLDRAAAETESHIAAAISVRKPEGPLAIGTCHNCGATLDPGHRWCGKDCMDDWEADQEMARRARERS
jgi:hypothetical protein